MGITKLLCVPRDTPKRDEITQIMCSGLSLLMPWIISQVPLQVCFTFHSIMDTLAHLNHKKPIQRRGKLLESYQLFSLCKVFLMWIIMNRKYLYLHVCLKMSNYQQINTTECGSQKNTIYSLLK